MGANFSTGNGYDVKLNKASVGYCSFAANQTNSNSTSLFSVSVKEGDTFTADAICPCTPTPQQNCPNPSNPVFYYYPGATKLDTTKDGLGLGQPRIGNGTFKGPFAQSGILVVYDGPPEAPLSSYVGTNGGGSINNLGVILLIQGIMLVKSNGINTQYLAIGIAVIVLLVILKARASASASANYPPSPYPYALPYAPPYAPPYGSYAQPYAQPYGVYPPQ